MALVTIQLIEGLERGRVYCDLPTPVTIGREDDNTIQLNDERVSRFHAKVQEDGGRVILTDLDSTNGTRVNGHPVQMRVVQVGDQLSIGRCLLVFGSREQVADRVAQYHRDGIEQIDGSDHTIAEPLGLGSDAVRSAQQGDFADPSSGSIDEPQPARLFPSGPPEPPRGLRPLHRAEFSDFLAHAHDRIRAVLEAGSEESDDNVGAPQMTRVAWPRWQELLQLEMDLAVYLRKLSEPDE